MRTHDPSPAADALVVRGMNKQYGDIPVLRNVSLTVRAGEVHALVGENGAGKSTLIKTVAGAVGQDSGTVSIWGQELDGGQPGKAAAAGLAVIYQELTIVPEMTALANVLLGRSPRRFGFIDRPAALARYREAAAAAGTSIPAGTRAGDLSTANQQMLEIMRALASHRRLIVMDEPTASLGPEDSRSLHKAIRELTSAGCSIVYISHNLDDVLDIADSITVLREGAVIDSRATVDWDKPSLIVAMLGGNPAEVQPTAPAHTKGRIALSVRGLTAPGVDLPTLDIREGEIIGLAGLVGSGRTRLLRTLAGANRQTTGTLTLDGKQVPWPRSPRDAIRRGIALAPEDRKDQALVLDRSAAWNVALGQFAKASGRRPFRNGALAGWASPGAGRMGFDPSRLNGPAGTLSGGNQQKLVLARWLDRGLGCLLLDEPTRGIDIGAKAQIFATVRQLADEGLCVIWCSSDLDEVTRYSDRTIVLASGRAVAELPARSTVQDILTHTYTAPAPGSIGPTTTDMATS
ncbi:sugar ABC transporter ATP-binding protein [Arthrobacter sp. FW306-2-2C-D06B]|uniref:sugar ABC transporter ATP-binding protein n=1 Tax=Arthrobacter sp. FW306-2-2C-D06B TaxID=2879618 RepID=UPI001F463FFE|nr:sugar ABC transporter ATP-binding protein [Arthrobacter sp. FW306-2-2C-D06B]UKA60580.1 sugar ABC transporter ATP-binding protein [Arthrobacter sp. FW306-2-2C-D06B]